MHDRIKYKNIAYFTSLLCFLLALLDMENSSYGSYFNLIQDLLIIVIFVFATLWIPKLILFIGTIFYLIGFNIELISNNFLPKITMFDTVNFGWLPFVCTAIGIILILIGLFNTRKIRFLTKEIDINPVNFIGYSLLATVLFQSVIRL
jgi:hypothetical protein